MQNIRNCVTIFAILTAGALAQRIPLDGIRRGRLSPCFDPSGEYLFSIDEDNRIQVVECETGKRHSLTWNNFTASVGPQFLFSTEDYLLAGPVAPTDLRAPTFVAFHLADAITNPDAKPSHWIEVARMSKWNVNSPLLAVGDLVILGRSVGFNATYAGGGIPIYHLATTEILSALNVKSGELSELGASPFVIGLPKPKQRQKGDDFARDRIRRRSNIIPPRAWLSSVQPSDGNTVKAYRSRINEETVRTKIETLEIDLKDLSDLKSRVTQTAVVALVPSSISPDGSKYTAKWYSIKDPKPKDEFISTVYLGDLRDGLDREDLIKLRTLRHEGNATFKQGRGRPFVTWTPNGDYFFVSDWYRSSKLKRSVVSMHSADGRIVREFSVKGRYFGVVAVSHDGSFFVGESQRGRGNERAIFEIWKTRSTTTVTSADRRK